MIGDAAGTANIGDSVKAVDITSSSVHVPNSLVPRRIGFVQMYIRFVVIVGRRDGLVLC